MRMRQLAQGRIHGYRRQLFSFHLIVELLCGLSRRQHQQLVVFEVTIVVAVLHDGAVGVVPGEVGAQHRVHAADADQRQQRRRQVDLADDVLVTLHRHTGTEDQRRDIEVPHRHQAGAEYA